ncbi:hypothetical protein GCM10010399_20550 [Dactylosporangium fulvum]|uniref:Secreted protein n=1 Tax=Dactylosporangium fulvum TaxID=53359 RepID=A0ABY5W9J5_9ACTN|nr:hypothetical protein [Dactylosporangium fulvum]UWP84746.1 hypothetical protein Dfulv_11165 [Dactylosporangium fulvum]
MDALEQAHRRGRFVSVLTLVMALLFGATIGASSTHSGAAHQLLGRPGNHTSWAGERPGGPGGQHPLLLHTEGERVENQDAAGHAGTHLASHTTPALPVSLLDRRPAGVRPAPAPARAELQVWRT